jgi:diacylglycerol O-acyltransferase / wax synthase
MYRLRGSDAYTIYSGTHSSPFVTMKTAIYKPVDPEDIPHVSDIRRFVKAGMALHGSKGAGMRVMRVPLDIHHPVWVSDPEFSIDDHIYHIILPSPGNKAQLCDFISDLMGRPLDPNRPLWEAWIVDGLEDGRIAVVAKNHHVLADGMTTANIIARSHMKTDATDAAATAMVAEPIPGKARLMWDALLDLGRSYTVELPAYYQHLKQAREGSRSLKAAGDDAPAPFTAPHTVLNEQGGRYRTYRYEMASLAELKAVSKKLDCTLNTLVMGICAEALRRYLLDVDSLPESPLIVGMPMGDQGGANLKSLLHSDIHNNSLAVAFVPLDLTIADFEDRLQAIKRGSAAGIDSVRRSNGRRFDNYLDFLPGTFIRLLNSMMDLRQSKKQGPYVNLPISNVPGPRGTLYAVDGRLELVELLSTGNLMDVGALNITVWSYVDNLCFSCYYRKGAMPDPEKLNTYLGEILREIPAKYLGEIKTSAVG